ncbi:MAG: CDP-alcohol phosphatidyltransferase family protein, partial [Actinomycetia bacterium]|nr:CDP-alcohol phosphatidyltransferase family protein [Actinomycetes bacterium]
MTPPPTDRPQVITIANLVSLARMLLVALLWWLLVADQAVWAAWLMILMATTDWLDGWLARRLDQVTLLG